ncbi:hypothetical protein CRG98_006197 [Punica granatum]|uniref:Uncharacterized protein n=1 Tax=Punica granatum TaxID=22663 RepID=A0A2I0KY94_PUNGR|nr:hypothetical protein CRG98_006197 [Punica granatum]
MGMSPAHISLLALLLSSEPHRDALLKMLVAAQVPKETAPGRIEETVSSIFSNQISFAEDELPSEGYGHLRALHIVCKCNNHIVGRKLKFFAKGKLITVNGEEDYAIYKETVVPYVSIGKDKNLPFHSFDTISVIRDYGEVGPSRTDRMIGKALSRARQAFSSLQTPRPHSRQCTSPILPVRLRTSVLLDVHCMHACACPCTSTSSSVFRRPARSPAPAHSSVCSSAPACALACLPAPLPHTCTPAHAHIRPLVHPNALPMHPNVLPRIPPSHLTL